MSNTPEPQEFDVDSYFETMKKTLGIDIQPDWEATVKAHLITASKMASIVESAPININSIDLSNTFTPGIKDV